MTVLLLGATGMAGEAIREELSQRGVATLGVARSGSDISCDLTDEDQVTRVLCSDNYSAFINSAAQVDVNRCETDPLESWKINAKLVAILAKVSHELNIPLLHISTDHYYPYGEDYPHTENDPVLCVNEYARHKYAGEAFALAAQNSLVLRTSILGVRQKEPKSLIEWAIDGLREQERLELFCDAWTSSLDVDTFAKLALKVFFDFNHSGLLNIACHEVYSKEQLIRTLADMLSIDHSRCVSRSIKSVSRRPNCLGLDVSKAERLLGQRMPDLEEVCSALVTHYFSSQVSTTDTKT